MSSAGIVPAQGADEEYDAWSQADSDSSDDGEDADILTFDDLAGIGQTKTVPTGLRTTYKTDWGPTEGFREVFQNWRDAICRTTSLRHDQFSPKITETRRHIMVEVRHPIEAGLPLLGFMRFQRDDDDNGVLEVTNFNAKLYLSHLSIGGTTKATDGTQTGKYGEGLKLAALTFRRHPCNYTFRIEASSFRWNSNFNTDRQLQFKLTRVNPDTIKRQHRATKNKARTVKSHIWEDVKVVIGAPARQRRSTAEGQIKSQKIPLASFRKWLTVTMDLDPPEDLIRTAAGDLVLSPTHAGRLYLQGLRLPHGSATGRRFKYGYNLRDGELDRDRRCLSNIYTEASTIASIWAESIRSHKDKDNILSCYTDLLMKNLNKVADVMIYGDTQQLDQDIAAMVWQKMLEKGQEEHGQGVFYYTHVEGQDDIHIIQRNLRLHPVSISEDLWKILSAHQLCRTPTEEQEYRLSQARVVHIMNDLFAQHIGWFLKCFFASSTVTKHIKWEFVEGRDLGLDVVWVQDTIKIHDKWIDFEQALKGSFCHDNTPSDDPFGCDEVLLWLWDLVIAQLACSGQHPDIVKNERWLKGMARVRLAQAPRDVSCLSTNRRGEVAVRWTPGHSHKDENSTLRVTLHLQDCPHQPVILPLHHEAIEDASDQLDEGCDCPTMSSISASADDVVFADLSLDNQYVPEIKANIEGSFPGLPPSAVSPASEDVSDNNDLISPARESSSPDNLNPYALPSPRDDAGRPGDPALEMFLEENSNTEIGDVHDDSRSSVAIPENNHEHVEYFAIGEKINHSDLDWGHKFPGSHDFYRTRDEPHAGILVARPKANTTRTSVSRKRLVVELDVPAGGHLGESALLDGSSRRRVRTSEPSSPRTPRRKKIQHML